MRIGKTEIFPWLKTAYNNSMHSERMIEIALMQWFLKKYDNIIEVGAVSPYYVPHPSHKIYDPCDPSPFCVKKLAEEIDFIDTVMFSISTIEHIGNGDYGLPIKKEGAVSALMMKAKTYLITWAAAQNTELDLFAETLSETIRVTRETYYEWKISPTFSNIKYFFPYPYGNGLYVVTNCSDLITWDILTLIKAEYGGKDVRASLQQYITDGSLHIPVNNFTLAGDPCVGSPKKLVVEYILNKNHYTVEVKEGEELSIPFKSDHA